MTEHIIVRAEYIFDQFLEETYQCATGNADFDWTWSTVRGDVIWKFGQFSNVYD